MSDGKQERDINPAIGSVLAQARDVLTHEHSLFRSLALEPILIGRGKTSFGVSLPGEFAAADGKVDTSLLTIIMDSIFGITVFTSLDTITPIATVNLRADYHERPDIDARAICTAECTGIHNEIAHVSGDIRLAETKTLLSTGAGAFMVGTKTSAKGSRW